jgi:RecA/RadA recombinase
MTKLSNVIRAGEKKYGTGTFLKASSAPRDFPRIPSGIFPFDRLLGGGFPVGCTSSVWGPPGSSKTYIAQKLTVQSNHLCHRCHEYIVNCQCKEGPLKLKTLFIDCEGSFAWDWADDIGVPPDLDVVYGLTGEEFVDVYHSALRATDVGLIVIDSIADLTPNAEMAGSAEDNYVMTQARLVSYMIRKGKTLLMKERKAGHSVTILMLNQVRAKPAVGGRPSEEAPGGNASKHDFTLSARTGRRAVGKMDERGLPEYTTVSISLGSAMSKKKCLVLAGVCQFNVSLSSESEFVRGTSLDFDAVLQAAINGGFITEGGSKKYIFDKVDYTKKELLELFHTKDGIYYPLQKRIIDKLKQEFLEKEK